MTAPLCCAAKFPTRKTAESPGATGPIRSDFRSMSFFSPSDGPGSCMPLRAVTMTTADNTTKAMERILRTAYFTQCLFSNSPSRNSGLM